MVKLYLDAEAESSAAHAVDLLTRAYDAEVKNFIREKQILAVILKSCVTEFYDAPLEKIAGRYIEGTPKIGGYVDRDTGATGVDAEAGYGEQLSCGSKIAGGATEDRSVNEDLVVYDLRFTALAPGTGEPIKLIINVETQRNAARQRYPLVKRALYYCARMLSAQKNVEFSKTHYEDIKKVYSIWICQGVPKDRQNTIIAYGIEEQIVAGNAATKPGNRKDYDLATAVIVGVGDAPEKETAGVLGLFATAFSSDLGAEEKKRILTVKFGIKMTEAIEKEVYGMCSLGYGIYEKGVEQGIEKGIEKGMERGDLHARLAIAVRMISRGSSDEDITSLTDLSSIQVAALRAEQQA